MLGVGCGWWYWWCTFAAATDWRRLWIPREAGRGGAQLYTDGGGGDGGGAGGATDNHLHSDRHPALGRWRGIRGREAAPNDARQCNVPLSFPCIPLLSHELPCTTLSTYLFHYPFHLLFHPSITTSSPPSPQSHPVYQVPSRAPPSNVTHTSLHFIPSHLHPASPLPLSPEIGSPFIMTSRSVCGVKGGCFCCHTPCYAAVAVVCASPVRACLLLCSNRML